MEKSRFCQNYDLTTEKLRKALDNALKKIDANLNAFETKFPRAASENNVYPPVENDIGWTQGFWTGIIWIAYELTGNEIYRQKAELQVKTFKERIEKMLGINHHDMGFLYTPSCVAAYKLTGNEEAKAAALMAADYLISRYHEKGEFIQAWGELGKPESYRLIIDCLLNIPLLYWATEVTGEEKYAKIGYKHFNTTIKNIAKEDGSTYHTFYFDVENGAPLKGVTAQGNSDDSCWARGQAWGMYGPVLTYLYKHNSDAIEFFKRTSNYYLEHLPEDCVAYWDMDFTEGDEERDSSAAAIAVCALLAGAELLSKDDPDKELYHNAALTMLNSLIDNYAVKPEDNSNGLLLHAVYSKPANSGVDECNIWGDYFYMEALARLIKKNDFNPYW